MDKGRYFLFDVPEGLADEVIKQSLGELINYPKGIESLHWVKAATKTEGGVVQLKLDEKAVRLIKERSEYLYVDAKPVIFVDKEQLATKTMSTIDDDLLEVVKQEMGTKEFGKFFEKLKMTKFKHKEGYDCWRIEGAFSDIKAFEMAMRQVLFRDNTVRNGDHEADPTKAITSAQWSSNSMVDTLSFSANKSIPIRIEFCVGELFLQTNVDAIVVPTDVQMNPESNLLCLNVVSAMGEGIYKKFRQDKLQELGGFVPICTAVTMENVKWSIPNFFVKSIIFVTVPTEFPSDQATTAKLGKCYDSIFKMAEYERCVTLACPPLGLENGVGTSYAAVAAMNSIIEASCHWDPCLTEYLDVLRFVFPNEKSKNEFVAIFREGFEIYSKKQQKLQSPVTTRSPKKKTKGASKKAAPSKMCPICFGALDNKKPKKSLEECNHEFHLACIETWHKEKQNCPVCAAANYAGCAMVVKSAVMKLCRICG